MAALSDIIIELYDVVPFSTVGARVRTPIVAPLAVTGRHGEQSWRRERGKIPRRRGPCTLWNSRASASPAPYFVFDK